MSGLSTLCVLAVDGLAHSSEVQNTKLDTERIEPRPGSWEDHGMDRLSETVLRFPSMKKNVSYSTNY